MAGIQAYALSGDNVFSDKFIARFWSKVNKNGPIPTHRPELGPCWVWTASLHDRGYGQLGDKNGHYFSHRISWTIENGPIPDGLQILHHCDNRTCVRNDGISSHLFIGTQADNIQDMCKKGRHYSWFKTNKTRGEQHGHAKLTEQEVITIRERYSIGGISQKQLAAEFNVSQTLIGRIVRRVIWTHI